MLYAANQDVVFTIDADYKDFIGLYLENEELGRDTDYTAKSGSVIITLEKDYIAKLPVGTYMYTAKFDNGGATFTLEVLPEQASTEIGDPTLEETVPTTSSPQEVETSLMWLYILSSITIMAIIAYFIIRKYRLIQTIE